VSDHRNRHRASEPEWPTGDDSKPRASAQNEDRTGFWSPLWEDDDDDAKPSRPGGGQGRRAQPNGNARSEPGSHARRESGNHARNGGADHRWPDAEPPAPSRHAEKPAAPRHGGEPPAPPRPSARRGGPAPAWPSGEEAPPPRRPGGPHTPPPAGPGGPGGPVGPGGRPPAGQATRVVRPRPAGPPRPGPGGKPPVDPNGPTELMSPTQRGIGSEPQLLTHREPDYDEDVVDDPDDYIIDDQERPVSDLDRKRRRKKVWKRVRRGAYVLTTLGIIGPIVAFFVAYQMVEVPNAQQVAADQEQVVSLTFTNGAPLSTIVPQDGTRNIVRYDEIPDTIKHAVFAAEDAEFMTNPGFDLSGVVRAGWNQVSGGAGGGSTITQQYIKKATGNDQASGLGGYTRKFTEVVKAYKMNNTYSKEQILEAYLNTIYFGRSANGIVAAAKAYYNKNLKDVTPSEAALLAGMIQTPGKYRDLPYMQRRWKFVMDQMVDKGWVSAADRQAATFPAMRPLEEARPSAIEGPGAHIQKYVLDEVQDETNMDLSVLKRKGYTIETTIDPNAQQKAEAAITKVMTGEDPNIHPAMTVVNPRNGEILAYYGGKNGNGVDWAKTPQEPGSSFKPFDLVALLEDGKGLGETYNGTSGRQFVENGPKIRNASNATCGEECTVAEAMKRSINTVFYDIALNTVGTNAVADAAHQAGITSKLEGANGGPPDANISIGGGSTQVSTLEMASAYATFAANGIYRKPHMVKRILAPDGSLVWEAPRASIEGTPAFDKANSANNQKIARNVTESLLPIPEYSRIPCAEKRLCAGKTGTHQFGETEDNAKAWMVGYTPSVSAAVSMGAEVDHKQMPLKTDGGKKIVYGSGLPGKIWQTFMNEYLKGTPKETFGKFTPIGKAVGKGDDGDKKDKPSNSQTQTQPTNNGPGGGNGPGPGGGGGGPSTQTSEPDDTPSTENPGGGDPPGGGGGGGGGGLPIVGGGGGRGNN
jgi:membrane peptidoglycan carboxypeptidase